MDILMPTVLIGVLSLIFGVMLAWFSQKFAVEVNPLVQKAEEILPGANCGACGFPGCSNLAEKIVAGEAPPDACPAGGPKVWAELSALVGKEVDSHREAQKAVLLCQGAREVAGEVAAYQGLKDCKAAHLLGNSFKSCRYGCLGFGNCVRVCPFEAMIMDEEKGLPIIIEDKCTGCGKCVEECPRSIITLLPAREQVVEACVSLASPRETRQSCKKGCIKCSICVKSCPEGAIILEGGRIKIDRDKCNLCGVCIEKCPTKCLIWVGNELVLEEKELEAKVGG